MLLAAGVVVKNVVGIDLFSTNIQEVPTDLVDVPNSENEARTSDVR